MTANREVARAWRNGQIAASGHLATDGKNLYSYKLKIGYTDENGMKVVLDYTAKGGRYISITTSTHVGIAKKYADKIAPPKRNITRYIDY